MARANTRTLLALDDYAKIMSIPGWLFNQVTHPVREAPGCQGVLYQQGYVGDPTYYVGRDEIAEAIAVAEGQIASVLGFWPSPKYVCEESIEWIDPKRGSSEYLPVLRTHWAHLQGFGVEAFSEVQLGATVTYSDEDGDGYDDTATITVASLYGTDVGSKCEVLVVFHDQDAGWEWEIRPLDVEIADDGTITITGPRWLFVDPDVWETVDGVSLDDDASFVTEVDVYRAYHDDTDHGDIIWNTAECKDGVCLSYSQTGCCLPYDKRLGLFTMKPATYGSGAWVEGLWTYGYPPDRVEVSYLAGYDGDLCEDCSQMGMRLKTAIVRLANTHIVDAPCECTMFKEKFRRDREELDPMTRMVARAEAYFGSTMRGAVFALSVLDQLDSIGKGG
jgi:hypothetical protein